MPDEDINQEVQEVTPADGGQPSEQAVTTEAAAPSEPSPEEQALQELESAPPEERTAKREGLQKRIGEITRARREAEQERDTLRLQLAQEQARREVYEQLGLRQQQAPAVPVQTQEPVVPTPAMPARPAKEAFMKDDGYGTMELDQVAYLEAVADWKADCKFIERDHQMQVERAREDTQKRMEQGNNLINATLQKHPDIANLLNLNQPSPQLGESIGILATRNQDAAMDMIAYLVKNPAELRRMNAMHRDLVQIEIGQLAAKLAVKVPPKTTTQAAPPIKPVEPSTAVGEVDLVDLATNNPDAYVAEMNRREFGR